MGLPWPSHAPLSGPHGDNHGRWRAGWGIRVGMMEMSRVWQNRVRKRIIYRSPWQFHSSRWNSAIIAPGFSLICGWLFNCRMNPRFLSCLLELLSNFNEAIYLEKLYKHKKCYSDVLLFVNISDGKHWVVNGGRFIVFIENIYSSYLQRSMMWPNARVLQKQVLLYTMFRKFLSYKSWGHWGKPCTNSVNRRWIGV